MSKEAKKSHNVIPQLFVTFCRAAWTCCSITMSWPVFYSSTPMEPHGYTRLFAACNITRHIESSYILQPPKYLLIFVNRFRYLNDNITKDSCPIPLDMTVMLGPLKFNLQATIDHHGPSIDSGHYTASFNCCKKTFYCNDHKITEFGITDKNSSTVYIVLYKWIDTWFLDSNRRVGVWSLPWRWHILSIPLTTGRGTSAETCGSDDVFPPDDLGSRPEALCWYICIYICTFLIRVLF